LRSVALIGTILGVVGAGLDFASGLMQLGLVGEMSMVGADNVLDGAGLFALGVLALVTGLMISMRAFSQKMNILGASMEVCGILMGLASTYVPGMNGTIADLMLVLAVLMFLNGALMQSRGRGKKMGTAAPGQSQGRA